MDFSIQSQKSLIATLPDHHEENFCVEDIKITGIISDFNFMHYSAISQKSKKPVLLKVFPRPDKKLHKSYLREARFMLLQHPNLIKPIQGIDDVQLGESDTSIIFFEPVHSDLLMFCEEIPIDNEDKLARTYFRHLIEGIEYLHRYGIAHLDIRPELLMIGLDMRLKITGLEYCFVKGENHLRQKLKKSLNAPEIDDNSIKNPYLSDVFSAGIILLFLKFGIGLLDEGKFALSEKEFALMLDNPDEFCKHIQNRTGRPHFLTNMSFKKLFQGMIAKDPKDRLTIERVKKNTWFRGPVYSMDELVELKIFKR